MKLLKPNPNLAEQVYDLLVDAICRGELPADSHLVQEQIAARLGVSRQPVQQAMARLKGDGVVEERGGRGLRVAPLDPQLMRHHYDIRAALDGLAARLAAGRVRDAAGVGAAFRRRAGEILAAGARAVELGDTAEQVRRDRALHALVYETSGNPLLARTAEPHWRFLQRAMGEVLRRAKLPAEIWLQHSEIAEAVAAGDPDRAERLMVEHDLDAARTLQAALVGGSAAPGEGRGVGEAGA